jgi:hypothetical protein
MRNKNSNGGIFVFFCHHDNYLRGILRFVNINYMGFNFYYAMIQIFILFSNALIEKLNM